MRLTLLILLVCIVGCGRKEATTVTQLPDAFRRLELLGYRQTADSVNMGQRSVSYKRTTSNAEFSVVIVKWTSGDRIKEVLITCYTDEEGFKSDSKLNFWDEMERDFISLVNAKEEYLRAAAGLEEVQEKGTPVLRHEGRATTEDGWQILVIEDVRQYKPRYENPDKYWARVGLIWATHIETDSNIPADAVDEFNRQLEAAKEKR